MARRHEAPDHARARRPKPGPPGGGPRARRRHQLLDPTTFPFCMENPPVLPDLTVVGRWAILLDPTTFGYTSKGTEKSHRPGLWKLVDVADAAAPAAAPAPPAPPAP